MRLCGRHPLNHAVRAAPVDSMILVRGLAVAQIWAQRCTQTLRSTHQPYRYQWSAHPAGGHLIGEARRTLSMARRVADEAAPPSYI